MLILWRLSHKLQMPLLSDRQYVQNFSLFDKWNKANSSVLNTPVTKGQLQVSWDEILGWIIYRHFQICREILLVCVHGKRATSCSRYIGWETDIDCLYNPFIQKEAKMKPSRYQVNLFIYKLSRFVKLACLTDITWEKKLLSSLSYHKRC